MAVATAIRPVFAGRSWAARPRKRSGGMSFKPSPQSAFRPATLAWSQCLTIDISPNPKGAATCNGEFASLRSPTKNNKPNRSLRENLDWSARIIDRISAEEPDIIALTETFNSRGTGASSAQSAETLDGPTMQLMRSKAKQHSCYLIPSFIERRGAHLFNTSVVIDRKGEIVGQYDKIHPTNSEIDDGIVPGDPNPTVIGTDFGKVGCQICFDANWPMDWKALADAGAEIIYFQSAYPAGRTLNSMATLFHIPIVAANTATCCDVIDIDGLSLAPQGIYRDWVIATLHLDSPLFHLDYQFEKMERIRVKYGKEIAIRVYEREAWWRIDPQSDRISVPEIVAEFKLETLKEYLDRATAYQKRHREQPKKVPDSA